MIGRAPYRPVYATRARERPSCRRPAKLVSGKLVKRVVKFMEHLLKWLRGISRVDGRVLEQSLRTALAAMASTVLARALKLPEYYWAPITTFVVMQSTLGAALKASGQRFAGTALGAAAGAVLAHRFGPNVLVFGVAVVGLGVICALLRMGRAAYRFSGITLAIVMLIARNKNAWQVGADRFIEVSVGIAVGLLMTALWPERASSLGDKSAT